MNNSNLSGPRIEVLVKMETAPEKLEKHLKYAIVTEKYLEVESEGLVNWEHGYKSVANVEGIIGEIYKNRRELCNMPTPRPMFLMLEDKLDISKDDESNIAEQVSRYNSRAQRITKLSQELKEIRAPLTWRRNLF